MSNRKKNKIIIFIGHFLPGFKTGGPVKSIKNLIDSFYDKADFYVVTNDRDKNDKTQYKNIEVNEWNYVDKKYNIFYCDINKLNIKQIVSLCEDKDVVYSCGFYDKYALRLALCNRFKKIKNLYVAPMGNFSKHALKIKKFKKSVFFFVAKLLNLFRNVTWSFTSEEELIDFKNVFGKKNIDYLIAKDLPNNYVEYKNTSNHIKGPLKIIFISRINKKKNLTGAIKAISNVKNDCVFDIYGYIEDKKYFNECKEMINRLPSNIKCKYNGEIVNNNVLNIFKNYDILLFPTKGENYGHVIFESLQTGCVPLISKETIWDIETKKAGFRFNYNDYDSFAKTIDLFAKNRDILFEYSHNASDFAKDYLTSCYQTSGYRSLFDE